MNFISLRYALFLTLVIILYYTVFKKFQWQFLLGASLLFYACSSPFNLLVLTSIILITYLTARLIETRPEKKNRILSIGIILTIGCLCLFKYHHFLGLTRLIFPLGMSFYTFIALGYCIDVYREEEKPEKNIMKYALFVSFFPQLIEGPISGYGELAPQLFQIHSYHRSNCKLGLQRIAWGVFKKVVIANQISVLIDPILQDYQVRTGVFVLFGVMLYAIWIYADFSGFIDIAIGSAQMLGIQLSENFNTPYFSKSVAEYWRRWHMSLGLWFQKYVFYSLLRSKILMDIRKKLKKSGCKKASHQIPTVIALLITWTLIGFWHGAEINFPIHGFYFAVIMSSSVLLEKTYKRIDSGIHMPEKTKDLFRMLRTFLLVLFGYLIFWPGDIRITATMAKNFLSFSGSIRELATYLYVNIREIMILFPSVILLLAVDLFHLHHSVAGDGQTAGTLRKKISELSTWKRYALYIGIVLAIITFGAYGSGVSNQFAYFRF